MRVPFLSAGTATFNQYVFDSLKSIRGDVRIDRITPEVVFSPIDLKPGRTALGKIRLTPYAFCVTTVTNVVFVSHLVG